MAYIYSFEDLARERIEDIFPDDSNAQQELFTVKLVTALRESYGKFLDELADELSQQAVDEQDD